MRYLRSRLILVIAAARAAALQWPDALPAQPALLERALAAATDSVAPARLAVAGHVTSRRVLGRNLAFVDIESLGSSSGGRLQAILRSTNGPGAVPRPEVIAPGARVALLGRPKLSPRGSALLVTEEAKLLTAAPSEHGCRATLTALCEGRISVEACTRALSPARDGDASRSLERLVRLAASGAVPHPDDIASLVLGIRSTAPAAAVAAACGVPPSASGDDASEAASIERAVSAAAATLAHAAGVPAPSAPALSAAAAAAAAASSAATAQQLGQGRRRAVRI